MIITSDPPLAVRHDLVDDMKGLGYADAAEYANSVGSTLNVTIPRQKVVLDYGAPTTPIPTLPQPEPGELSPLHGVHRIGVADTVPFIKLLPTLDVDYEWESRPWAHGRHNFPMRGVGWAISIGIFMAAILLMLIIALTNYFEDEPPTRYKITYHVPMHSGMVSNQLERVQQNEHQQATGANAA